MCIRDSHYAGLFQHGVHLDGLRQGGVAGLDGLVQYELGVVLLAGGLQRTLGGQAGDCLLYTSRCV